MIIVLLNHKTPWYNLSFEDNKIYFRGYFWYKDGYYTEKRGTELLLELYKKKNILSSIRELNGHFAFIIHSSSYVIAAVDRYRTIPIFYSLLGNDIVLSDHTEILKEQNSLSINQDALLEFSMSGYTLAKKTLFNEVSQIQPGQALTFYYKKISLYRYFNYKFSIKSQTENQFIDELNNTLENTFGRYINSLNGQRVFIPLSGGLDSRLILAFLRKFNYENVVTYTYGIKGLWEIKRAQHYAAKLKYPWYYIQYDNKIKRLFHEPDRKGYFKFATNHSSIAQIPEYYGLMQLQNKINIFGNEIIINGQSGDFVTGGHIPKFLASHCKEIDTDKLFEFIINKHFALWTGIDIHKNHKYLKSEIIKILDISHEGELSKENFADLFETFEWQERQSKYVINGQRAYEWFNLGWRLPLWDNELVDFWLSVPWNLRLNQSLHKKTLKKFNYGNVFNNDEFQQATSYSPLYIKPIRILALISKPIFRDYLIKRVNEYSRYFMNYAPFYPHLNYIEYCKESKNHRSPVSFWSKYYLEENNLFHQG